MDLKWHLVIRVGLVAWLCLLAAAGFSLHTTLREADAKAQDAADAIARTLELQLFRIDSNLEARHSFPDWTTVFDHVTAPGQCATFRAPNGALERSDCNGALAPENRFEALFSDAVRTFASPRAHNRAVAFKGQKFGELSLTTDAGALAHVVWSEVVRLALFACVFSCLLAILLVWVISRALAPTQDVIAGLNRLASGDLSYRLPSFDLVELDRIGEVFNDVAARLEETQQENARLARTLVDVQEQDRQRLAQELHDELAQNLSGLSAIASSIKTTADRDHPALAEEAALLSTTLQMMARSVRHTLTHLRPPEIDDLGLGASIRGLIAALSARSASAHHVDLQITGDIERLPATSKGHVYRIVQEALTNIERHSRAGSARICLAMNDGALKIAIEDDGVGAPEHDIPAPSRFGLIGMRERVMALGGKITTRGARGEGFAIAATIPVATSSMRV